MNISGTTFTNSSSTWIFLWQFGLIKKLRCLEWKLLDPTWNLYNWIHNLYYVFKDFCSLKSTHSTKHSRPQRPRSFWSAPRIATSGLVQRHSVFEWLCKYNRMRPEPIRFAKLDSEHAQSDGMSVNRGLPVLDLARGRDSWCWPKGARPLGTRMSTKQFKPETHSMESQYQLWKATSRTIYRCLIGQIGLNTSSNKLTEMLCNYNFQYKENNLISCQKLTSAHDEITRPTNCYVLAEGKNAFTTL